MSQIPDTNVIGVFSTATKANAAVAGLRDEGFAKDKVGVQPQGANTIVTVQADGRHAAASASMENDGASNVQNVAR